WRHRVSGATRPDILNRLSELRPERYEGEVGRGLSEDATGPCSARAPRTRRGAEDSTPAPLALGMPSAATASAGDSVVYAASANESDYLEAAESRARYTTVSAAAILDFLRSAGGWHAKSDIVAATGLSDGQWNTLIADLVARGLVERQGERRGARYRLVESRGTPDMPWNPGQLVRHFDDPAKIGTVTDQTRPRASGLQYRVNWNGRLDWHYEDEL